MGDWPARLLHIPSMTSLKWEPGNFYGGHREPGYAVLSYTWGRWELRCAHPPPRCPALGVRGLDWAVPSVCPRLFSVAMFEHVLASVAAQAGLNFVWLDVACIDQRPGSRAKAREIGRQAKIFGHARHAFIWLLDPRDDPPPGPCCGSSPMCGDGCFVPAALRGGAAGGGGDVSASVPALAPDDVAGRPPQKWHTSNDKVDAQTMLWRLEARSQALERAHRAWLSGHMSVAGGPSSAAEQKESSTEDLHNAATAAGSIAALTSVPWFSSTWTLQEAFIQPSAVFLDREGDCCWPASPEADAPFSLSDLLACCRSIHRQYAGAMNPLATRGDRDAHVVMKRAAVNAIERTGLQALADRDRMTLYACAQLRHARNRNDWVYGIMQVWGFQLGESAVAVAGAGDGEGEDESTPEWTLEDLELELGSALLREFSVESQLPVHTNPPPGRQAWRISAHSATPLHPLAFTASGHLAGAVDRGSAQLGVRRAPDGRVYGHFRGRSCAFETLRRAWASAAGIDSDGSEDADGARAEPFRISLDFTHVLNGPALKVPYSLQDVPDGKHAEVADKMGAVFRELGRTVSVLHLATVTQPLRFDVRTTGIGLIVMNCPDPVVGGWRKRLGVCLWDGNPRLTLKLDPGQQQVADIMSVESPAWIEDECIFG